MNVRLEGSRLLSRQFAANAASSSRNVSHRVHNETPFVAAVRVNIPDHSARESTAETQPKFQPRFLRLRAIIFQYFTRFDSLQQASDAARNSK
jgi:hypothetical protein